MHSYTKREYIKTVNTLKNDSSASYMVQLLQTITSLNLSPHTMVAKISTKTIKNAVKFVQSLTKLNPDIVQISVRVVQQSTAGDSGIHLHTEPVNPSEPVGSLDVFLWDRGCGVVGYFLGNQTQLLNIPSTPAGINLIIQMEKMYITDITNKTIQIKE